MSYRNGEGYRDPTMGDAINRMRWEELQRLREEEHGIKRGEIIALKLTESEEDGKTARIKEKRMKVIELYKHFVLLESPIGIRESMSYWKLCRCRKTGGESGGKQRHKRA